MSNVDRLISSLVRADVDHDRASLARHAQAVAPDLAPLATAADVGRAVDSIVGLGPLEGLLAQESVTDVLVNGPDEVWVERNGILERTAVEFRDADDVVATVRRVISPLGLRIDRAEPAVDARLPDGSRLHAVIPPAAVERPVVAIRRFRPTVATMGDLLAAESIDDELSSVLTAAVGERRNILVAGATGSGKTTLLNILCAAIDSGDRVVTIEDAAELRISGHVVRLESRRANIEGVGDVTMRDLVRHSLRLRPDRIVVGEVRGPEALDMLQALNTGHRGSMSTIHANGAAEALVRLESLAAMAQENVPTGALRALVRSAIDVVVVTARIDGARRVVEAVDVEGAS